MGISHCSDDVLQYTIDDRYKIDNDLYIDIDIARKQLLDREIVILDMYLSGYTMKEIREKIGLTKQMVSLLYKKIVAKLKKCLSK